MVQGAGASAPERLHARHHGPHAHIALAALERPLVRHVALGQHVRRVLVHHLPTTLGQGSNCFVTTGRATLARRACVCARTSCCAQALHGGAHLHGGAAPARQRQACGQQTQQPRASIAYISGSGSSARRWDSGTATSPASLLTPQHRPRCCGTHRRQTPGARGCRRATVSLAPVIKPPRLLHAAARTVGGRRGRGAAGGPPCGARVRVHGAAHQLQCLWQRVQVHTCTHTGGAAAPVGPFSARFAESPSLAAQPQRWPPAALPAARTHDCHTRRAAAPLPQRAIVRQRMVACRGQHAHTKPGRCRGG